MLKSRLLLSNHLSIYLSSYHLPCYSRKPGLALLLLSQLLMRLTISITFILDINYRLCIAVLDAVALPGSFSSLYLTTNGQYHFYCSLETRNFCCISKVGCRDSGRAHGSIFLYQPADSAVKYGQSIG